MTVRMQADDFFKAYKILAENDATFFGRVQKSASDAHVSAKVFGSFPVMNPGVVCLAFSVELYIKDLYFITKGKIPKEHNILKLYKRLPEEVRQKIYAHEAINRNPFVARGNIFLLERFSENYSAYDGFIYQLKVISDGFEKWRYSYESSVLKYEEWFALAFIESIKSVADQIRVDNRIVQYD